ncbi:MAG: ECF-type sigma factor [Pirellulales bacterium]
MTEVTRILAALETGDKSAADRLLLVVYDELRNLAAAKLAGEQPGMTLQATALVHEAYLRLTATERQQPWANRQHFFAAAAEAMRRILIDEARARQRLKRGGNRPQVPLDASVAGQIAGRPELAPETLIAVHEALDQLAAEDDVAANLVKHHIFLGLTLDEAGEVLGISRATTYRLWSYARAWLKLRLTP